MLKIWNFRQLLRANNMVHPETVAMNVTIKSKIARCVVVPGLETSLINNRFVFSILEPIEAAEWSKTTHPYEGPLGGQLFVMGSVVLSYKKGPKIGHDKFTVVGSKNLDEPLIYDIAIPMDRLFLQYTSGETMKTQAAPPGVTVSTHLFNQVMNEADLRLENVEGNENENEDRSKRRRIWRLRKNLHELTLCFLIIKSITCVYF